MSKLRRLFILDIILEVSFWIGVIFGALFGLSFAQRKGKELRDKMSRQYKKEGCKGIRKVMAGEFKDSFKEAIETGNDMSKKHHLKERSRQKVEEIKTIGKKEVKKLVIKTKKEAIKFANKKLKPAVKKMKKKIRK